MPKIFGVCNAIVEVCVMFATIPSPDPADRSLWKKLVCYVGNAQSFDGSIGLSTWLVVSHSFCTVWCPGTGTICHATRVSLIIRASHDRHRMRADIFMVGQCRYRLVRTYTSKVHPLPRGRRYLPHHVSWGKKCRGVHRASSWIAWLYFIRMSL